MAVAVNDGVVNAEELDTADGRRKRDISDKIWMVERENTPLISILMHPQFKKGKAKSPKVEWLSSTLLPRVTTAAEAMTDVETDLSVAAGTGIYFRANDVIRNVLTNESMLVVSVASDVLTIKRGWGTGTFGTSGIAFVGSADTLMRVANAAPEGSLLGEIRQVSYSNNYNYTQITRTAGGFTRTATETELYGGDEPAVEARRKAVEHKKELNDNVFWGARQLDTSGTQPRRGMGGLAFFVQTNVMDGVGTLTEAIWLEFLGSLERHGSNDYVVFVSPLINAKIQTFVRGSLAINSNGEGLKKFGLSINSWVSPQGKNFKIVVCPDWSDFPATANTFSPAGCAFAVDMSNIELAVMHGTEYRPKQEANDEDSRKFDYLTEQSLRVGNEEFHGILAGVTG